MDEISLPKYERVATVLRKRIMLGVYAIGTMLPPEPVLQQEFSVSRATIRSAVQLLVRNGLVEVHQGRGTTVRRQGNPTRFDNVTSLTELNACDFSRRVSRIDEVPIPNPLDAAFLGMLPHATAYRFQRIQYNKEDIPVMLHTNYLSQETVPGFLAYDGQVSDLYTFLLETYGIRYKRAEETISAEAAGLVESQVLQVPVGAPLLSLHRFAYSTKGPMECSHLLCRPDQYKVIVTMED